MEKPIYTVGGRVEKVCPNCNEQLGHVIKSITKQGKISRVTCSRCSLSGTFKSATLLAKLENLATQTSAPYDPSKTYRSGQFMLHPTFGQGEIMTVIEAKKIDVLFTDQVRRLIHSRS
jgi:hypothetical protein